MTPPFAVAFQPIVDVETGLTLAQEALVRGPAGESAGSVLASVAPEARYRFDAEIRRGAMAEALRLGLPATNAALTLNIFPGCIGAPEFCATRTMADAEAMGFPTDRLIFEISEMEPVEDPEALGRTLANLQRRGLRIALDDVGTGHARIPLLMVWRPDGAKIAREVIMGLDKDEARFERVRETLEQLLAFGMVPVVEGIETPGELAALRRLGVRAMQGYLFARPGLGVLPVPVVPRAAT
ncbi:MULTISPECIES: EAL domain-containing protein [Roseomonadaceae]|uniref:EAL domain-containing protein n=1 Tax=Falsiroseomonas oleicola TaxID=2801474 RepID=A0ABS6H6D5_9PROT|nr:EAL domain-containing protein [Roseomonas oleicola]MBU8543323.1 EAL domain-containing protein [Roseomonas oleicola]